MGQAIGQMAQHTCAAQDIACLVCAGLDGDGDRGACHNYCAYERHILLSWIFIGPGRKRPFGERGPAGEEQEAGLGNQIGCQIFAMALRLLSAGDYRDDFCQIPAHPCRSASGRV